MPGRCCWTCVRAARCRRVRPDRQRKQGNPLALLELPRTWIAGDLAGGFALPGSQPEPAKSSRVMRRLQPTALRHPAAPAHCGRGPHRGPVSCCTAGGDARHRRGCSRPGDGAGLLSREVGPSGFPHPLASRSRTVRQLSRTAGGTPCPRRGDRHRGGPGPPRLAPRPGYARARRGGRDRARALRRPGSGARRGRCCCRLSPPARPN